MIRAGALADLVAFDLGGVRLAGTPDAHLIDGLVFAGAAADVRDVIVGGRVRRPRRSARQPRRPP